MNESQYINLQVKQWRAITVNWDILATNSLTESRLYCLTDFQVAWLLSMTEYMRWSTRWENCPCTQNDLEALKAETDYNLMSCIDIQPWQIDAIYSNQQNGLLAEYDALWDGSLPSSVNPDAPDDFFDGDGSPYRVDALCTALTLWTYSYAVEWMTKASTILGVASFVSGLIDFMIPVGGSIAVRVLKDLTAPLTAQLEAFQNQTALDDFICDWKAELDGVAINPTNWTNAVDIPVYTVGTPKWHIQQIIKADTELLDNFLSFVNSLGNGYELAQLGVEICACFDCEVDETWDFTVDQYASVWFPRQSQIANMNYIPSTGWQADNPGGVQLVTARYERVDLVEITYTFTGSGETPTLYQYRSSTGVILSTIGAIPWSGNESVTEDILVALFAPSGTWTATIETIRVVGCRRS